MKNINVKSFWKGTVLSDITFTNDELKEFMRICEKRMFMNDKEAKDVIKYLNGVEKRYHREYKKNGTYSTSHAEMFNHMLLINYLVSNGFKKNDNNFGLQYLMKIEKEKNEFAF